MKLTEPEIEIAACWWDTADMAMSRVGQSGVVRIVLRTDGHGLSGFYDRIHVFNENGRHLVFPAHHVSGWEIAALSKAEGGEGEDV